MRTGAVGLSAGNHDDLCASVGCAGMRQRGKEAKYEQRNESTSFHRSEPKGPAEREQNHASGEVKAVSMAKTYFYMQNL